MRASALVIPIAALAAFAAPASIAAAQVRPGTLAGVVTDSLGAPLSDVEITAVAAQKSVRTDSLGRFLLPDLASGRVDVRFRRLSYRPVALLVTLPPVDTTEIEVRLGVVAEQLTGMVVQAHPEQLRQLVEFESRRSRGIGHFITRAEIEDRHPLMLSDMLRTIPGANLISAENGRTSVRFARVGRNNCPPQFFVDGIEVTGFSIDDMPPGDVEGVELYAGAAGLPPEYNRLHGTSICGTIIIWTRIPGSGPTKGAP